jgi:tellurite resistance protein TerC
MRAIFILAGITLIQKFHWVIYVFGAFLLLTGVRMVSQKETKIRPEKNPIIRLFRQVMPVSDEYREEKFFLREAGRLIATPLIIVLIAIETTDVIFAVDSIPAILAITLDPFIVYSSNVCAILGLRALYFALAGVMKLFHFLHYGLSAILVFIGIKMILTDVLTIPIGISLAIVGIILLISVAASVITRPKTKTSTHSPSSSKKKL